MLAELYSELVSLHLRVQKLAANGCGREADNVFDQILKVEDQICATPAATLDDAMVKLRLFKVETSEAITERQRQMLDEVIAVLRRATEH